MKHSAAQSVTVFATDLLLLPEKAIFIPSYKALLVSDVHLGKSETFQALGVPISNQVNQSTVDRLTQLCQQFQPERLYVLGDLFHSRFALVDEVIELWFNFTSTIDAKVQVVIGNHDRALVATLKQLSIDCSETAALLDRLLLSHEPEPHQSYLNICGHIHPCVQIKTRLDRLRLPCFYFEKTQNVLMLPSFGEFTGSYEMKLKPGAIAYVIAEGNVIPFTV